MLDHLDVRRGVDRRHQRSLDLRPRRVASRVGDPVAVVAALARQREHPVGRVVEVGAERDQLAHRLGALVDQDPHRGRVAGAGARDEGVALVLVGAVARSEGRGDASLGPWVEPAESTSLVTTRTLLTWCRRRRAAVRPAMPEPTTTTSASVVQPGSPAESRPGPRKSSAQAIGPLGPDMSEKMAANSAGSRAA